MQDKVINVLKQWNILIVNSVCSFQLSVGSIPQVNRRSVTSTQNSKHLNKNNGNYDLINNCINIFCSPCNIF